MIFLESGRLLRTVGLKLYLGPKPIITAIRAIILHIFGVQVGFMLGAFRRAGGHLRLGRGKRLGQACRPELRARHVCLQDLIVRTHRAIQLICTQCQVLHGSGGFRISGQPKPPNWVSGALSLLANIYKTFT